jgi:hypothetical protein
MPISRANYSFLKDHRDFKRAKDATVGISPLSVVAGRSLIYQLDAVTIPLITLPTLSGKMVSDSDLEVCPLPLRDSPRFDVFEAPEKVTAISTSIQPQTHVSGSSGHCVIATLTAAEMFGEKAQLVTMQFAIA